MFSCIFDNSVIIIWREDSGLTGQQSDSEVQFVADRNFSIFVRNCPDRDE